MSAASTSLPDIDTETDQSFVIRDVSWEGYVALNDALGNRRNLRVFYFDGELTLLTESRKHGWYAERLSQLVVALSEVLRIPWEDAASATFRRRDKNVGVEGDKTFYFYEHAELMEGSRDIDLTVQPPPDLAIEVEISHPADSAMAAWGRLCVAEVWRFDPIAEDFSIWLRRSNGRYVRSKSSAIFPMLTPADLLEQMKLADKVGARRWHSRLRTWVRKVIVPREQGGP
jgi:Uma2 family endonuclease